MREILIYWVVGCLVVGLAAGQRENRCPREQAPTDVRLLTAVALWPMTFTWAWVAPDPPACRENKP